MNGYELGERRNEAMEQKILFRVKVKQGGKALVRGFRLYAETWEEALAFARQKGEPMAIAVEK